MKLLLALLLLIPSLSWGELNFLECSFQKLSVFDKDKSEMIDISENVIKISPPFLIKVSNNKISFLKENENWEDVKIDKTKSDDLFYFLEETFTETEKHLVKIKLNRVSLSLFEKHYDNEKKVVDAVSNCIIKEQLI